MSFSSEETHTTKNTHVRTQESYMLKSLFIEISNEYEGRRF